MYEDGEDRDERTRNQWRSKEELWGLKVHENHYGLDSNQNKRQSSEPIHSQFPLISETPTSAKSLETRKHLKLNTVVNLF